MTSPRSLQRGLSLIELMVGCALGLFVIAGALALLASNIEHCRRMLLQARIHQDLRAAGDIIARDLRRAAHWQNATQALGVPGRWNPYSAIDAPGPSQLAYVYSQDEVENDIPDSNEHHGFRVSAGVLQTLAGGSGWQPLTDPSTVVVTQLELTPTVRTVPLGHLCLPACMPDDPACPRMQIREVDVHVQARAAADASVVREVHERVRLRNDELPSGGCP
jgi:type IV pilus assembly protein PilW